MSGASIRFSKYKSGSGGPDAWRDSLNKMQEQGGRDSKRPRTTGMELPKENTIHQGSVVCVKDFGVFLQLGDGTKYKDGMMHVTHMGESRVENPEDFGLKMGTKVWVKVGEIKEHDMKYSLDMRYVDQRDGKDLDPYHTKGRLPDNHWTGATGKAFKPATATSITGSSDAASSSAALENKYSEPLPDLGSDDDDSDDSSDDSSEKREKMAKKLKKAKKKLEKARKKAEKAKQKDAEREKKEKEEAKKSSKEAAKKDKKADKEKDSKKDKKDKKAKRKASGSSE